MSWNGNVNVDEVAAETTVVVDGMTMTGEAEKDQDRAEDRGQDHGHEAVQGQGHGTEESQVRVRKDQGHGHGRGQSLMLEKDRLLLTVDTMINIDDLRTYLDQKRKRTKRAKRNKNRWA